MLKLRLSVTPGQAAKVLQLCHGIQEHALQIPINLPDNQNPLHTPLNALRLATLSLDLTSTFYGPMISLPELPLLCRIRHLHLTNGWVARCGLYIGLQELHNLTHVSFPVQSPGQQTIHTEILTYILHSFPSLWVVILWRTPYQGCRVIYNALEQWGFVDRRIVVFNAAQFAECADDFWMLAEMVVQW